MGRFYVPKESVKGNKIIVTGEEAHHILDVMRLKKGDKVVVFDGTGKEYAGSIADAKRKTLIIEITDTRKSQTRKSPRVTLIQAIPKKDKMDYIVEKATELGVSCIIPIFTQRTIPDWDDAKKIFQYERWQKIAKEAAKQCGRVDIPQIDRISNLEEAVKNSNTCGLALIAALSDDAVLIKNIIYGFKGNSISIAIGPEGDFTPIEIGEAKKSGFKVAALGSRVLKSDTAAIAVLAMLNYEFTN